MNKSIIACNNEVFKMDLVEVLLSRCIEKYEEAISGVSDDEFYGTVPKLLIIEYMEAVRKTKHFYSKTYIKSWNYRKGDEIEERHKKDEEDNPTYGMYFSRAKALFYYDQERKKAFVELHMGPRYARGFAYDIESKDEKIELANEKLEWIS